MYVLPPDRWTEMWSKHCVLSRGVIFSLCIKLSPPYRFLVSFAVPSDNVSLKLNCCPRQDNTKQWRPLRDGPGRGGLIITHGRSRMTIDPRSPLMPGRTTSGFNLPDRHCWHQARSAVRCWASCMKGELHPTKNHFRGGFSCILRRIASIN